jgi:addiction module HigA family antidote
VVQIVDYQLETTMAKNAFAPVTPGDMLKEEFLVGYGLSQNQPAKAIGISPNRIAEIVNNRRRIDVVNMRISAGVELIDACVA